MTYTHLLFDLDGTLFDFDAGEIYAFHKVCDTFHIQYSDEVLSLYPIGKHMNAVKLLPLH